MDMADVRVYFAYQNNVPHAHLAYLARFWEDIRDECRADIHSADLNGDWMYEWQLRLLDLQSLCTIHPEDEAEVLKTLAIRPQTVKTLLALVHEVTQRFGTDSHVDLCSAFDEQGGGRVGVNAWVYPNLEADTAETEFRKLHHEWWYPRVGESEHGIFLMRGRVAT